MKNITYMRFKLQKTEINGTKIQLMEEGEMNTYRILRVQENETTIEESF